MAQLPLPRRTQRRAPLRVALVAALAVALPAAALRAQGGAVVTADGDAGVRSPTGAVALDGEAIVRAARHYLGVPYRWGGVTPRAFDCSGFTRWVFAENGIALPRTAREQAGVGDAPYPGDLRPGDLLFFWGGNGAQHVAIYAGNGSIIHASSRHGRVRIDRLGGHGMQRDWFGRRLIAVRRVAPAGTAPRSASGRTAPTVFAEGAR